MNLKAVIKNSAYDEYKRILKKLAKELLKQGSGVFVFLDVEKEINIDDISEVVSTAFDKNYYENDILVSHNNNDSLLTQYRDQYEDMISISEIAELAYKNYNVQFADGVVQWDYKDKELYGASFTTGTLENPENPVIELYRIKSTSELDTDEDGAIAEIEEELNDNWDEIRENLFSELPENVFLDFVSEQLEIMFYQYEDII